MRAGDIVALRRPEETTTGDTLCDPKHPGRARADGLPRAGHRDRDRAEDQGRPGEAGAGAARLATRIRRSVSHRSETGQTIITGMGELHLEIIVDRLKREFKVDANVGKPQVAYRETITRTAEVDYTHKKQTGGSGQYAARQAPLRAAGAGHGLRVRERRSSAASCRRNSFPAVEKGSEGATETGVLAGFPVIDCQGHADRRRVPRRRLQRDGVRDRGPGGLPEGVQKASPKLLEPIMKVEVVTPEEYMGDVIGDLNSRRGPRSRAWIPRANAQVINAMVPLGEHVRLRRPTLRSRARAGPRTRCISITTSRSRRVGWRTKSPRQDGLITRRQLSIEAEEKSDGEGEV